MEKNTNIGFVVYWMNEPNGPGVRESHYQHFGMDEMSLALNLMETLRNSGMMYVGMVSQNPQSVCKPGVSDKLPEDYSWTKQHRGAGPTDANYPKSLIAGKSHG